MGGISDPIAFEDISMVSSSTAVNPTRTPELGAKQWGYRTVTQGPAEVEKPHRQKPPNYCINDVFRN
jgi:hypothetical protein